MKMPSLLPFLLFTFCLASCDAETKGMNRKVDGSSDVAAKKSVEKITAELSPDELQKFKEACGKLVARTALAKAFSKDKNDTKEFLAHINGKTPQEIIDMASSLNAPGAPIAEPLTAKGNPETSPIVTNINLPFNIDGVEIRIVGFRIGNLEGYPNNPFLLVSVNLKNTTEGTIVHLQDLWGKSNITDNFGNVYSHSPLGRHSIKGVINSQRLKPGESVTDLMIFDTPLENSQKFTLTSDPNFFRPSGNNLINQISSKSFKLDFTRADFK